MLEGAGGVAAPDMAADMGLLVGDLAADIAGTRSRRAIHRPCRRRARDDFTLFVVFVERKLHFLRRRRIAVVRGLARQRETIDAVGARMVAILFHPGREFEKLRPVIGGVHVALKLHMAHQDRIGDVGDLVVGLAPIAGFLKRENLAVAFDVGRRQRTEPVAVGIEHAAVGHRPFLSRRGPGGRGQHEGRAECDPCRPPSNPGKMHRSQPCSVCGPARFNIRTPPLTTTLGAVSRRARKREALGAAVEAVLEGQKILPGQMLEGRLAQQVGGMKDRQRGNLAAAR